MKSEYIIAFIFYTIFIVGMIFLGLILLTIITGGK